jgi:hypothetical protein
MVASFIAVIWDIKQILIHGNITIGIQPKVKYNFIRSLSFGNPFIALVSQILNMTLVKTLLPIIILSIELELSHESIVLDLEPVS